MNFRISTIAVVLFLIPSGAVQLNAQSVDDSVRGFLAIEAFEVRLEAIAKVDAYRRSWRLEGDTINAALKQVVLDNVATLLESGVKLSAPGKDFQFTGRSVRFIRPDPAKGYTSDERDEIPIVEALVGITLSSSAQEVRELSVEWLWFAPEQKRLVLEIASRGKPSARYVTPDNNQVTWTLPETVAAPTLLEVPAVKRETLSFNPYLLGLAIFLVVIAAIEVIRKKQKSPAWVGWLVIVAVVCGLLAFKIKIEKVQMPGEEDLEPLTYALLRNTYHAFDFREESAIYDTLEQSVSGPLLEKIYVEIRSSLELENNGGPRVKVYEIALREAQPGASPIGAESDDVTVLANWATIGEVTHWGHTHERMNRYEARMKISPFDETWKVVGLDLLNEERVQKVSRRIANPTAVPAPSKKEEVEKLTKPETP